MLTKTTRATNDADITMLDDLALATMDTDPEERRWRQRPYDAMIRNAQDTVTSPNTAATNYELRDRLSANQRGNRGRLTQSRINSNQHNIDRNNLPWGDDLQNRERQGCRFVFQNINGISKHEHYTKAHEIGEAAQAIGANVVGLSETNTDWKKYNALKSIQQILRKYWTHTKMSFSSSDHTFDTEYQP